MVMDSNGRRILFEPSLQALGRIERSEKISNLDTGHVITKIPAQRTHEIVTIYQDFFFRAGWSSNLNVYTFYKLVV